MLDEIIDWKVDAIDKDTLLFRPKSEIFEKGKKIIFCIYLYVINVTPHKCFKNAIMIIIYQAACDIYNFSSCCEIWNCSDSCT